ncbi:MAG: hypothetical protein KJ737_20540 [Proteobacteria bacterium]|nr:hypothetical protein [Pseudomonadota bacterium]
MFFMSTEIVSAGAWPQEKGKSYHRLAGNYYFSDKDFNSGGDSQSVKDNGEFTEYSLNYYGEYGILDTLTLFGSLYYKDIERDDDYMNYKTNGVGDVDLGLRFQLYSGKPGVFSLQGLIKIPAFYDDNDEMPLGNGQYDYELRLMYGRSLWPVIPGYMNIEAGYRIRDEDPSDEFRYLVEIGSDLGKKCYARAKLDALVSMENADNQTDEFGNPTSTLEYDLAKLDMTLGFKITPALGLELGYTPALWGKNTAKGTTWTFAVSFQHGK